MGMLNRGSELLALFRRHRIWKTSLVLVQWCIDSKLHLSQEAEYSLELLRDPRP